MKKDDKKILKSHCLKHLHIFRSEINQAEKSPFPSCVITGARRCGKTTVSNLVAKRLDMIALHSDQIRDRVYGFLEPKERRFAAFFFYKALLSEFPNGIILEGTAFMDVAKNIPLWGNKAARVLPVFMIGSSYDAYLKYEAILEYRKNNRCWTSSITSGEELLDMAKKITQNSLQNKQTCSEQDFTYLNLSPDNFSSDVDRSVQKICLDLKATAHSKQIMS